MRKLGKRPGEILDPPGGLAGPPEIVGSVGQEGFGGDRCILHTAPLVPFDDIEVRFIRDGDFEGMRFILLRNRYDDAPSLTDCIRDAALGLVDVD